MNLSTKSIAYSLIAKGFNIFVSEEDDTFIAENHICKECLSPWYMELTECFLCCSYNPFIYYCANCGTYFSITGTSKKCRTCQQELNQCCINDACLSNTDPTISAAIKSKYTGVFDKKGCFNIAQTHCLKCGGTLNKYVTFKIKVYEATKIDKINDYLRLDLGQFDILIIKFVSDDMEIKYLTLKKTEMLEEVRKDSFLEEIDLSKFI